MSSQPHEPPASALSAIVDHDALPTGTRFGELEIRSVLGVGGFGIVYLARDHALERDVALKEYMPASLASRGNGTQITIRSGAYAETYAMGLRSFVNEARLLARFDHPSLLKVYRFWEDNGTAYMVMPYLRGKTLRDARRAMVRPPDEAWIRAVLEPVMGALETLHREGVYHRDIAPDNILLTDDGPPVLLDFGAARRVISDRTQSLTAILKPSYAPIEQYAEMSALRQGPWTDLYALGAVVHFLLLGAPPVPATARAMHDEAHPLARSGLTGVSKEFLAAIDWALCVRPQDRPRSVDELRAALDGRIAAPASADRAGTGDAAPTPAPAPAPRAPSPVTSFVPTMRVAPAAAPKAQVVVAPPPRTSPPASDVDPDATIVIRAPGATETADDETVVLRSGALPGAGRTPAQQVAAALAAAPMPPHRPSRGGWLAAGGAGLIGLAAVAYWMAELPSASRTPAPVAASAPLAEASAAESAPVVAIASEPLPSVRPEPAVTAAQVEATTASAALAPTPLKAVVASAPASSRAVAVRPREAAVPRAASLDRAGESSSRQGQADARPTPVQVRVEAGRETAVAAPAPAAQMPATAREACGSRVLFALWSCMERECRNPRYSQQPDCVQLLENRGRHEAN